MVKIILDRILSATKKVKKAKRQVNQKAPGQVSECNDLVSYANTQGKNIPGKGTNKYQNMPVLAKAYQGQRGQNK